MSIMKAIVRDNRAATAIEYGLIVALVAIVIVASVTLLGVKVSNVFTNMSSDFKTIS